MLVALVLQGPIRVLAGTTGTINGSVVDPQSNKPIAGAAITAQSPSQLARTTSDATGRFSFISLAPDTYTISVAATSTYDAASVSGVTVQADQALTISLQQPSKLKVIGSVTSRAASALVKAGTTADVYSINATTQDKASAVGGGGGLNSAWSAIATVPGVFIQSGQAGYIGSGSTNGATISIRGGDYSQIGYELDGIPVNRAFDNYPSGSISSLGQQELQVYTGATPANAEGEGLSGYINQVIRTGTAPASRNLSLGIGTPTFYNKGSFEAGGANPSRTFSYYVGAGAYNQGFRYYDQYNGASLQPLWGAPLAACPNSTPIGCHGPNGEDYTNGGTTQAYALGPYTVNSGTLSPATLAALRVRDTVANFHFGIPRKDGNKDDVQLLFDNNFIDNQGYSSTNDQGGAAFLDSIGVGHTYIDGYNFTGQPVGTLLPPGYAGGGVTNYLFPGSPGGRPRGADIAPDRRDAITNNQSVVKLQYQRNFGTQAFLRVYGYTYYSDFFQVGPESAQMNYLGFAASDYGLHAHTRGVSAQFSDQLNSQHLLSLQGSYTTSTTLRDNNSGIGQTGKVGWLVSSAAPTSGVCYDANGQPVVGCGAGSATFTLKQGILGTVVPANTINGGVCGAGNCQYILGENGQAATYNQVVPRFTSLSITDQWKPTDRLNLNFGLRYDKFEFDGAPTYGSPARTLWYNAYNLLHAAAPLVNPGAGQVESYGELQPRFGMTYTVNPRTVLRASYGRYVEAPNSAFEQYDFLQQNDTARLARFGNFGLPTTPGHPVRPEISNNYDFSLEHQFRGDTSMKLTPFLRKTQDQIQQFYLDQKTGFVSGLNVGRQTSQGVELEVDKGDFSRNGLAARFSFTYTNSYINYTKLDNGGTIIDGFNTNIAQYNKLTAAGGGSPCYTTAVRDANGNVVTPGAGSACVAGTIANPYYNAPIQPLMDVNAAYATYSTFPGGVGAGGYSALSAPYVSTLILQWKHGPLAITPALQFSGGVRYGVPLSTPGIDPSACSGGLGGTTASDPRYPYGAPGGAPYDQTKCDSNFAIPNQFTGRFDNVGAFVSPNQLLLHTQVSYDVNKRVTLVGNFANIINRCWGGTKVPFSINHACNYVATYGAGSGPQPIGNQYNPGDRLQPFLATPYDPMFPNFPFNMFVEARIKI
ncbi:MAG TPA: TonB-dependent receptor [Candidatus Elarobacter sp.]|nr:TonB-dependent receptor [Candidatus Elarobacter sp.]